MAERSYRLVVFDWDGTIVDSAATIVASVHAASADAGLARHSDQSVRNIIGLGLREAVDALYPGLDDDARARFVDAYRLHFLSPERAAVQTFRGVDEVLRQLHDEDVLLAVATGKGRRGLDRELQQTGLLRYFSASRCADETRSKPHPQMLEELLDVLGVDAGEALMVGDTSFDLEMARYAGVAAVGVTYGAHPRSALQRLQARALIDDIGELLAHV